MTNKNIHNKFISLTLGLVLGVSLISTPSTSVLAHTNTNECDNVVANNTTSTVELGDEIYTLDSEDLDNGNIVKLYTEDGVLYQQTTYDKATNILTEYAYDSVTGIEISCNTYSLDSIVNDTDTADSTSISLNRIQRSDGISTLASSSYNYLFNEPLLDSDVSLDTCSDGYKYIGKTSYDGHNGYLRRSQSTSLGSAKRFTFSAGTKVTTAASAIAAVWTGFTSTNLVGALTALGFGLASAVIDYACSASVTYITIHNLYRVNVASSTRYSFCEKKTYWKTYVYCSTTNKEVTKYDSRSWIHGYTGTLYDNVVYAIQCYENGEVVDATC